MDTLTSILQAPINTILILAGIGFAFLGLFEVSKSSVRLRKGKTNFVPVILGGVLILGDVLYKPGNASTPPSTQEPASTEVTQATSAPTEPPAQTEASAPTALPSETPAPSATPFTKTLADGCITAQTWQPASINTVALGGVTTTDGCLNLGGLRISADSGGTLHFVAAAGKDKLASGIFMPISDQSVIEFTITANSLFIVYQGDPAFITFAIAPQDKPMAEFGSGRFKFLVDSPNGSILYITAGTNQVTGSKLGGSHPSYKKTYQIKLELNGLSMKVSINNGKPEDVTIPDGAKVLYIGYSLPTAGETDVEISGLTIDGQTP